MSEKKIWFKTGYGRIKPVTVIKETAARLTIEETKYVVDDKPEVRKYVAAKRSSDIDFFPTWEEAHAHMLAKAERELAGARYRLQQAQGALGNIKGMKKPEDTP